MVHPIHVHGMSWMVAAILLADNPDTWLAHCHNLMHVGESAAGMTRLVFRLIVQ